MVHPSLSETIYAIWEVHNHSWGEWTSNGNGTHKRTCSLDSSHTEQASAPAARLPARRRLSVKPVIRLTESFCRPPKRWQASILPFRAQGGENISKTMKAASGNADSGLTLYLTGPALWKQG